jgi:SAM-dependent methyltransferase
MTEAFTAFELAGWQAKAQPYHDFFAPVTGRLAEPLLDLAGVTAGMRVLDAATGPGYVAAAAARRGAACVGVDLAPAMVSLARLLHPDLDVRTGDLHALPFPDGGFDAVLVNFALMHVARPERAAAECARVLAPGGRLAVSVWDRPGRSRLVGLFGEAVAEAGASPPPDLPDGPPFFRFADDAELGRLLHRPGLTRIETRTVGFTHRLPSAGALWDGVVGGTVRTAAVVAGQPPDVRERVRAAFDRLVEPYLTEDGLDVPVSVRITAATKPDPTGCEGRDAV